MALLSSSASNPPSGNTPPVGLFGEQTIATAFSYSPIAASISSSGSSPESGSKSIGIGRPPAIVTSFSYSANVGRGKTTGVPGPTNAPIVAASSSFDPLPTRMFSGVNPYALAIAVRNAVDSKSG